MADTTSPGANSTGDTPTSHQCASCGGSAKLTCTGCRNCPSESNTDCTSIFYCSKGCQRAHWPKHKSECKVRTTRRSLYRAADLAQKIYLEFCFQTWGERVTSIEDDGNGLHISITKMGGHVLYHPFPTMPDFGDDDRAAVAVHANCNVGMMAMWEVIKAIFEGQDVEICEAKVKVLDCPRQTFFLPGAGSMSYWHVFWGIKLNCNEEAYFLDLSSAQFGHYAPLTSPNNYQAKIKMKLHYTNPGGHERYDEENMMANPNDETRVFYRNLGMAHGDAVVAQLCQWEKDNQIMARLLRLPQEDYDVKSTDLVELCKTAITKSIQSFHDNGTLVQRYGMTLLAKHDWTKQGVHPFEGDMYKSNDPKPASKRSRTGIYNHQDKEFETKDTNQYQVFEEGARAKGLLRDGESIEDALRRSGWFDDPEATRIEANWSDKRYAELTVGQKKVVKEAIRTQPISIDAEDLTSYDGNGVVLKQSEGPLMYFFT